jgi:hypothetical protein
MPLPAALVPAYQAAMTYLPSMVPFAGAAVFGIGMVATHTPDTLQLAGKPEAAAECIQKNVAALNTKLAATVQPLYGTGTMGVVLKSGIVSPPLVSVTLLETGTGSTANYRILQADPPADLVEKILAGC